MKIRITLEETYSQMVLMYGLKPTELVLQLSLRADVDQHRATKFAEHKIVMKDDRLFKQ